VNAYVRPLMSGYVRDIRAGIDELGSSAPLMIMQSSGGVMSGDDAALRRYTCSSRGLPRESLRRSSSPSRHENVIAFDMGGTTAKASLIENGRVSRSQEYEVGASSRPEAASCEAAAS
jgi:N-methylhydantoinase A